MVINNNNNNNGSFQPAESFPQNTEPVNKTENGVFLFDMPKKLDRAAMVRLSLVLGWSGIHFFVFRRPFLAVLHILLSLIGIIGGASIFFIFLFARSENIELLLLIACSMIIGLLLSILGGVINAFYWSIKSDEEFNAVYGNVTNKTDK